MNVFFQSLAILTVCFFTSSCEKTEPNVNNGELSVNLVEMEGSPLYINNDPSLLSIKNIYENYPYEDLIMINGEGEGDVIQRYLYARMLVRGMVEDVSREKGVEMMESVWREGVVDAGYDLFLAFTNGMGVRRNEDVAKNYLITSAELGYILSQQTLGLAYAGRSIDIKMSPDHGEAIKWSRLAADQGDLVSAGNLATIYGKGEGVKIDEKTSFDWLFRAETMPYGDPFTVFRGLARYYEEGIGTDVDLVQAYKYYDLLSPSGDDDKARIAEQMTPDQIHEAISLSRQWQEEHNIFVPSYYGLEYQEDGTFQ